MKKVLLTVVLPIGISSFLSAQPFEKNLLACGKGDARACYDAGKIYSAEAYKEKDYDSTTAAYKVASYYKKSCDLGYAAGCTSYAMIYAADREKDPGKDARYYFQKGCDDGDEKGCTILRMMPSKQ